ncbi:regulator of protease activity HflC (stomatin/prohibitin superfamily) [Parabacteroides sp. PF5-5]|uniref:slipin family protein n=1 Tax=unclassified Parabacteroides TaxID=2649774 RepID=UPI0024772456|nr:MULTISPECIES: slipin family protein [unclassified Parabacteroides]MDH6303919.1 regulator of protease activity HflC (stomatin/prohibitin superfamily) [Parabacteroides sp. PH5-39]MDH6314536.1 regulator of protease activity HflC (stomatin/prohibitin superfamily) [Parabacteroides sp. PF5-13]MDH6318399.1 regulator of protease activity HflC (stomatin/prohibitin superfamily) [Parabacteroides sp. PH5-13]MDH6322308.1 regulator of protease activity HflC (stomatin/prohibitin superfamily) [Parabacteroid
MILFKKKHSVKPNMIGFLYRNNTFEEKLSPGVYKIRDWNDTTELFCLPETAKLVTVTNQEVLSKDNIAFRFSFYYFYKIVDGEKFLSNFSLDRKTPYIINEAEVILSNIMQQQIRQIIAGMDSETLNEKRNEIANFKSEEMDKQVAVFGVEIEQALLKDITFPKSIQDLFAKHLEAKIRAKAELENARTTVATARALKNASELMKGDENIKFIQWMETITKIADKGKHTFVIGDPEK